MGATRDTPTTESALVRAIARQLRASPRLVRIWSKVRGRLWHEWLSSPDVASAIDLVGGCGYPIGVSQWMSRIIAASSLR